MNAEQMERVFGRGRVQMVTGAHVEVFREALVPGERRRYTKRFLETEDADFRQWTDREWRMLARLIGHGVRCVPDVVQYHGDARGGVRQLQTYDAGISVDQWASLLPVSRDGAVRRHVFEDCAHWWALAHHCLAALDEVHALHVVHLDLKADNICVPFGPPAFDPEAPGDRLHVAFARLALIDFAFSLVSHEALVTALPIGWQKDYDYQSPRLLAALEAGRAGDLGATQELDWRCDLYSLAAMLRRYLTDDDPPGAEAGEGGWTPRRRDDARALVYRLRDCHDGELTARPPHRELMELTGAHVAAPDLARSLAAGWTLVREPVPAARARWVTPLTRIIVPNALPTRVTAVRVPTVVVPTVGPAVFRNPRPLPAVSRSDIDMHAASAPPRRARPRVAPIAAAAGAIAAVVAVWVVAEPSLVDRLRQSVAQLRTAPRAEAPQPRAQTPAQPSAEPDAVAANAGPPDAARGAEQGAAVTNRSGTDARAAGEPDTQQPSEPEAAVASANSSDATPRAPRDAPANAPVAPSETEPKPAGGDAATAASVAAPSPAATAPQRSHAASRASRPVQRSASAAAIDRKASRTAAAAAPPRVTSASVAPAAPPRTAPPSAPVATTAALPYDAAAARIATANLTMQATRVEPSVPAATVASVSAPAGPSAPSAPATIAIASAASPAPSVAPAPPVERHDGSASGAPDHAAAPAAVATDPRRATSSRAAERAAERPSSRDTLRAGIESVLRAFGLSSSRAAPVEERSVSAQRSPNVAQAAASDAPRSATANRKADTANYAAATARPPERVNPPPPPPIAPRTSLAYANVPAPPARMPESPRDSAYPASASAETPIAPSPGRDLVVQPARAAATPPATFVAPPADAESDLGLRARRMLAGPVPSVAAQARLDAANVLSMASVPDRPLQRRYLIEAAQVPWRSERAYVTTIDGNEARYLHDAARQSLASGRKADALDLQLRAFAANPRDPDIAGFLAYLHLEQTPSQPETARQLALHALAVSGYRRSVRYEDWNTFAVASALTGREADATRAFMVELALSGDADRTCRAALRAYAVHGDQLRAPVEALLYRIRSAPEPPPCAWMTFRLASW